MTGSAVAGQPGNGERGWPALIEDAQQYTGTLKELAQGVGPDHIPSQDLITRLGTVSDQLRNVLELVKRVSHISQGMDGGSELAGPLGQLSNSIRSALHAVQDFRTGIEYELDQRADDKEWRQNRPTRRYLEDQRELRELAGMAERELTEVSGHMDRLLERLRQLT